MLEGQGYTLWYDDRSQFWIISQAANVQPKVDGEFATLKVIETPSVRPSTLQEPINTLLGAGSASIAYVDELGIMIAKGPARQLERIDELVKMVLDRQASLERFVIELRYIAASVVRDRALALSGGGSSSPSAGARNTQTNRNRVPGRGGQNNAADAAALSAVEVASIQKPRRAARDQPRWQRAHLYRHPGRV